MTRLTSRSVDLLYIKADMADDRTPQKYIAVPVPVMSPQNITRQELEIWAHKYGTDYPLEGLVFVGIALRGSSVFKRVREVQEVTGWRASAFLPELYK